MSNDDPPPPAFNPEDPSKVTCFDRSDLISGFFFEDEPFMYLIRIFPLQACVAAVIQAALYLVLKPFGETLVFAQILGGLLVGQLGLARIQNYPTTMYPELGGTYIPDTLGMFGCMLYLFLIGLRMDLSILKTSSKKERVIGILTFTLPMLFTFILKYLLKTNYYNEVEETTYFPFELIGVMTSTTSFHTVTCFLYDLNILNTEIGRLATSVSTISGLCSWVTIMFTFAWKQNQVYSKWLIGFVLSALSQVIFITIVLRQAVIWMIKQTSRGEPLKQNYLFIIFLMIMGTGFLGELFGQHCLFGPMILGLAIPNGPPVGSTLEQKMDAFISGLLVPLFFFSVGYSVNLVMATPTSIQMVISYSTVALTGKLIGTIIPCLFYQIPFRDASTLSLILGTLGTFDVQMYTSARINEFIRPQDYAVLVLEALAIAGVIAPLVRFLYIPSRRYIVYKKRTIQNVKHNAELRMLVCIYGEENVPTMINILEASNPTIGTPIVVYLLHIVELTGRATPLLVSHKSDENRFGHPSQMNHIVNGFKIFEKQNQGAVNVQPFTAITQFLSAHDDICTVALDKRTSFIVLPFHEQWNIDGTTQTCKWENANKKVLKYAPCSVGILIDRRKFGGTRSVLSSLSTCKVGVVFLGDADDREALCYGMRMVGHPNVYLTVHRIVLIETRMYNVGERMLDNNVMNDYRLNCGGNERAMYKEEKAKDGVEIINVIRAMENAYDLILVGRSHETYNSLLSGLTDWSVYPELGFFGDLFATSDFRDNASVLVIQQHLPGNSIPDSLEE